MTAQSTVTGMHKAFGMQEEEHLTSHLGEAQEPEEVAEGSARHRAAAPPPPQLPKLEELLQAKRPKQPASSMQDFEVLLPEHKVKVSSGSKREPVRKRSASLSSDSNSSSDSEHRRRRQRRRRSKSRDRSDSARHKRSYSSNDKKRHRKETRKGSKKARQRSRSPSSEREEGPSPVDQSDLMRDRIRAMLRGPTKVT